MTKPKVDEQSDYDKLDSLDDVMNPVVESEYDLKAMMVSSAFRDKDKMKFQDLLLKELTISNLPDTNLAFIYAGKMSCISDYIPFGWSDVAQNRLVPMLFRLQLLRSVDGHESDRMHGTMMTTASIQREGVERYVEEEAPEQKGRMMPNIMKLIKKR